MRLADSFIDQVDRATDIVRVIGATVALKPAGQSYKGLCPFHDEKTPSFSVSPIRRRFYCFGCSTGGTVFQFLMKAEGLSFHDAVKKLALAANLPFPEETHDGPDPDAPIYQALQYAATLYHDCLLRDPHAQQARDYLISRGLTPEDWTTFQLGYAPGFAGFLQRKHRPKSITEEHLRAAGLIVPDPKRPGGFRDRFLSRIIFPIADAAGRFCGFSGRVGPSRDSADGKSKYVNSAESPYFKKSKLLYLYDRALATKARDKTLILVEGYLDAIALHKAGWTNAVAIMGTTLSQAHLDLFQQASWRPVLCLDGDKAGVDATWKNLPLLLGSGLKPRVCTLSHSGDPDEFLRTHGPAAFHACLTRARPLFDWACDQLTQAQREGRADDCYALLQQFQKAIHQIPDDVYRHSLLEMLQMRFGHSRRHEPPPTPSILTMPPLERRLCHALTLNWLTTGQLTRLQADWCVTPTVARYVRVKQAQPSPDFPLVLEGSDAALLHPIIRAVRQHPDPAPTDPQALDRLLDVLEADARRRTQRQVVLDHHGFPEPDPITDVVASLNHPII